MYLALWHPEFLPGNWRAPKVTLFTNSSRNEGAELSDCPLRPWSSLRRTRGLASALSVSMCPFAFPNPSRAHSSASFLSLQATGLVRRRCRARRPSPATPRSRARRRRSRCRARAATASATAPASSSDTQAAAAEQRHRATRTCAGGLAPSAARRTNCSQSRNGSAVAPVPAEG